MEELSFGTRGGIAIQSHFPVDGEYSVRLELAGAARDNQQIEITIDGDRKQLIPVGNLVGRGARAGSQGLEFRIPIAAGPRLVGVTFVERVQTKEMKKLSFLDCGAGELSWRCPASP